MNKEMAIEEAIAALQGRAAFYDLLAALYYKPLTQDQIDHIAAMNSAAYAEIDEAIAEGFHDIASYLKKCNTGTRQELAVDFTAAFAGTSAWEGRYATPYESVFTSESGLLFQESYHEVYSLFKQNNVARNDGFDFPDDHLSFMCEFQSIVSNRVIEALKQHDIGKAKEQLSLSQLFLADHILSWFDSFETLALKILKTRFYRGVLKMSKGFFLFDAKALDDMLEEMSSI